MRQRNKRQQLSAADFFHSLEVGRVGVDERLEVDASLVVDPQPDERLVLVALVPAVVVVVQLGTEVAVLFRVKCLK